MSNLPCVDDLPDNSTAVEVTKQAAPLFWWFMAMEIIFVVIFWCFFVGYYLGCKKGFAKNPIYAKSFDRIFSYQNSLRYPVYVFSVTVLSMAYLIGHITAWYLRGQILTEGIFAFLNVVCFR